MKDGVTHCSPAILSALAPAIGEKVTMTHLPSQGDPQLLSRWSDSRAAVGTAGGQG
jgi:hypothetical protein